MRNVCSGQLNVEDVGYRLSLGRDNFCRHGGHCVHNNIKAYCCMRCIVQRMGDLADFHAIHAMFGQAQYATGIAFIVLAIYVRFVKVCGKGK